MHLPQKVLWSQLTSPSNIVRMSTKPEVDQTDVQSCAIQRDTAFADLLHLNDLAVQQEFLLRARRAFTE